MSRNRRIEKICPICSHSFTSYINRNRIYCNNKCYFKWLKLHPNKGAKGHTYVMKDEHKLKISKALKGKKRIFNHKPDCPCCICKAKRGETKGKNANNWKGDKALRRQKYYCIEPNCKNEISYENFKNGNKRCKPCSKSGNRNSFFNKKHSKEQKEKWSLNRKLELNAHWLNGKSFEVYPLGWNKTFKEQIRYRDGYKCQLCGKNQLENGRKLHVHHIDYDKKNLDVNNLISLCTTCHTKTNFNRKYWKEYFNKLWKREKVI